MAKLYLATLEDVVSKNISPQHVKLYVVADTAEEAYKMVENRLLANDSEIAKIAGFLFNKTPISTLYTIELVAEKNSKVLPLILPDNKSEVNREAIAKFRWILDICEDGIAELGENEK